MHPRKKMYSGFKIIRDKETSNFFGSSELPGEILKV